MQRKEGQPASQKDTVSHIVVSSGKPDIFMQAHLASQPVNEGAYAGISPPKPTGLRLGCPSFGGEYGTMAMT